MNDFQRDNDNPFSPTRRPQEPARTEGPPTAEPEAATLAGDEGDAYQLEYRAEDFAYDPDELLDDEEESEVYASWPEPLSARPAEDDAPHGAGFEERGVGARDEDDTPWHDEPEPSEDDPEADDWEEEEWEEEEAPRSAGLAGWPLRVLAVAVVALILLVVGGIGVLSERSALQDQVRDLQSQLAVTVDKEQLSAERNAQRKLMERNAELEARVQSLQLENRQLNDTLQGLEQQLASQQVAEADLPATPAEAAPAPAAAAPAPEVRPAPAPETPAAGSWFVNFGSYRQRDMAERWAERLQPATGKVVVTAAPSSDLFRVRVVSLPSEQAARQVAATLQSQFALPALWVGRE
jgi:SPOR domain